MEILFPHVNYHCIYFSLNVGLTYKSVLPSRPGTSLEEEILLPVLREQIRSLTRRLHFTKENISASLNLYIPIFVCIKVSVSATPLDIAPLQNLYI